MSDIKTDLDDTATTSDDAQHDLKTVLAEDHDTDTHHHIFDNSPSSPRLRAFVFFLIVFTMMGVIWQKRDKIAEIQDNISDKITDISEGFGYTKDVPNHQKLDVYKAGDAEPTRQAVTAHRPAIVTPQALAKLPTMPITVAPDSKEKTKEAEQPAIITTDEASKTELSRNVEPSPIADIAPEQLPDAPTKTNSMLDDTAKVEDTLHTTEDAEVKETDVATEPSKSEIVKPDDTLSITSAPALPQNTAPENDVQQQDKAQQEIAALEKRISALKTSLKASKQKHDHDRELLKQYQVFSSQMLAGENAETAYHHLNDIAPEPLKERLMPFAPMVRSGIADMPELQRSFSAAIEAAFAPKVTDGNSTMHQHMTAWFASLVTWRKVGMVEGYDDEAIIARAEVAMQRGNVADAVKELDALSVAHTAYFSHFLKQARTHLDARHRLESIQDAL